MRLTIPDPSIVLYEDGFDDKGHDRLGRKHTGQQLSELIGKVDDPLVVALDGPWGSGKSFFLKCWVGEMSKSGQDDVQPVYFDAFEQDFLDDPLVALTWAIGERIDAQSDPSIKNIWEKARKVAPLIGKAALRIGTAALVGKAISFTDEGDGAWNDVLDGVSKAGGDEAKALINFWMAEDGKRAAMAAFRNALEELTDPDEEGKPKRKLVLVVDELDRCRPDYALSLLEVMKHFFNVDGVHFVLGVNLGELENSVRARYGSGVDAAKYLQKFFHVRFPIPSHSGPSCRDSDVSKYFNHLSNQTKLNNGQYKSGLEPYLELSSQSGAVSLRDVQRIISKAVVTPTLHDTRNVRDYLLVSGLIFLSVARPAWIARIRDRTLQNEEFSNFLNFDHAQQNGFGAWQDLSILWRWALGEHFTNSERQNYDLLSQSDHPSNSLNHIKQLIHNYLEVFSVDFP